VSSVLEQPTSGVGGPSSPVVSSTGAIGSRQKRPMDENLVPIVDLSEGERGFMLPLALGKRTSSSRVLLWRLPPR
ncbi:hypothetical protein A2U01_0100974, partial [Trifolium medium]|nr:hypothetical protein [Trifolium medium]